MLHTKLAFVVCVLLCLTIPIHGSEDPKQSVSHKNMITLVRPHPDRDEKGTLPVTEGIENTTLWFVFCDKNTNVTNARCTIHVQDYASNSTAKPQKCKFLIQPTFDETISILPWMRAFRLRENKFLLSWIEYHPNKTIQEKHVDDKILKVSYFVRFLVIDMQNCESRSFRTLGTTFELTHMNYYGLMKSLDLRINENTIDVFYLFFGNSYYAQERFDIEGKRIKGPVGSDDFELDEQALKVNMYYNHSKSNIRSWERFNAKDVCGYKMPCHLPLETEDGYAMTTSRNALTSCKKINGKMWHCQSESLLNPSFSEWNMIFDYEPKQIMIYNVWTDRLVIMTSQQVSDGLIVNLTILGYDGSLYKPVEFAKIHRPISLMLGQFFINDDFDICFSMIYVVLDVEQFFNFVSKCYSKEALTKKL
ncbi:hypothetical protein QAD02_012053 [Eretmocerus hayati]|uniref:Uncharacterized protein n=1 Tax=Eretmocerus hayati TaxID=131215 RepID=A0ACC2NYT4_9HYME|nr:hypothetical protein QAD02_012053 [Eretmocerus hayati]